MGLQSREVREDRVPDLAEKLLRYIDLGNFSPSYL